MHHHRTRTRLREHSDTSTLIGRIYFTTICQCYKRILQIDPLNIQGLHNLCVVYVERGKLAQALDCLQYAHKLAPHEDYIVKHMKIVQHRLANLKQSPGMSNQKTIAFSKYDPKEFGGPATDNIFASIDDRVDDLIANVRDNFSDELGASGAATVAAAAKPPSTTDTKNSQRTERQKSSEKSSSMASHASSESNKNDRPVIKNANGKQANKRSENSDASDAGQHMPQRRGIIDHNTEHYQQYGKGESRYHHASRSMGNQRYRRQQYINDNSIPMFVHDMDDPSSGTS